MFPLSRLIPLYCLLLLGRDAKIDVKDEEGNTPLHVACCSDNDESASILLDRGADINATEMRQNTPHHCACQRQYLNVVELLLDRGANVEAKNGGCGGKEWRCKCGRKDDEQHDSPTPCMLQQLSGGRLVLAASIPMAGFG